MLGIYCRNLTFKGDPDETLDTNDFFIIGLQTLDGTN